MKINKEIFLKFLEDGDWDNDKTFSLFQRLTKEISEQEQATGRFQRNVGNYQSALGGLGDKFGKVTALAGGFGLAVGGTELIQKGAEQLINLTKAQKEVEKFFDLDAQASDRFTSKLVAMANTFDVSREEIGLLMAGVSEEAL